MVVEIPKNQSPSVNRKQTLLNSDEHPVNSNVTQSRHLVLGLDINNEILIEPNITLKDWHTGPCIFVGL